MSTLARSVITRALLLGIATGARSQIANGALALSHAGAPRSAGWRDWPVFRNAWGRRMLMLSAAGELVGDKLPLARSRLEPGSLAGRMLFGALAGAAIGSEGTGRQALVTGTVSGTVGAALGAFGGYHARKATVEVTGLPDPAVAVAEDIAAVSLANRAVIGR